MFYSVKTPRREALPHLADVLLDHVVVVEQPFTGGPHVRALVSGFGEPPVRVLDFHCEVTSEKNAMGWYLDGRVSAVIGTHTHVPTADARILPKGTAYISDVGMTGPRDSIIGMTIESVMPRFLQHLPTRFEVAGGPVSFNAVMVEADRRTGRANRIEPVQRLVEV
jgi:2',3'-cyclic-nucleotide 2'-phosphodiesterase